MVNGPFQQPGADPFVRRCLTPEYAEAEEPRTWNSSPDFRRILDAFNSGNYEASIQATVELEPAYVDFDLIYYWRGTALLALGRYDEAREAFLLGLRRAKRQHNLLHGLGETAWKAGSLLDMVYWWAQTWHCQETLPHYGESQTVFLHLYYVADQLGLAEVAKALIERADAIRFGQIRLTPEAAAPLHRLVRSGATPSVIHVLSRLAERYLGTAPVPPPVSAAMEPGAESRSWEPGVRLDRPGRLELGLVEGLLREEGAGRPTLGNIWVVLGSRMGENRYRIDTALARRSSEHQVCAWEELPAGEYLLAYNPFPIADEGAYTGYWHGRTLETSSAATVLEALSYEGEAPACWSGPGGGLLTDEAGRPLEVKRNTALCAAGPYPLVIEFLGRQVPYTVEIKSGQTTSLNLRTHAQARSGARPLTPGTPEQRAAPCEP